MRRFCRFCKKQNISNRDYCDLRCRLLEYIMCMPNGCWEWQGLITKCGYGFFTVREPNSTFRKIYRAHRLSYEIFKDADPCEKHVCHTCDNRKCVNPNHLWIGTNAENHADKISKGRQARCAPKNPARKGPNGIKARTAKLNDEKVKEIRKLFIDGYTQTAIAKIYQMHQTTISNIVKRENWKHVE